MKRKISTVRYVLLVLSLGMVAGSMVWHRGPSQFLSAGDPTQLTHPELAAQASEIPVQVSTPAGTSWKYVDFSQEKSLAEWLNEMGEQLFGKEAYAMSAPFEGGMGVSPMLGHGRDARATPGGIPGGGPQMRDGQTASADVGVSIGKHRGINEPANRVPNMVHIVARHKDGTIFYDQWVHNLRTNAGINWQYGQMAGTTAAVCTYIALSNSGATPAATDTALASEITTNGLARANGTPAHTSNATSYTLSYTFTATGSQSAQNAGMLNASSSGTLCFENTFSQVSMNSGDTLAVTWTVNF